MVYNYRKDYSHIFDTPAKKQQEMHIVQKIMDLLNKNKYDSIYDFITRNQTYQDFLKNNELENVVKHFGNTLNEEDFKRIQSELVNITEKKKTADKEHIKTSNVDGKEYSIYDGEKKDYFFDNSHSNMTIERQVDELQKTQNDFQSTDTKQNTENIMGELEKEKKESLKLIYLHEVDITKLNKEQKDIFNIVSNYQLDNPTPIRVDLNRGLMVDSQNNIMKVKKENGEFAIVGENDEVIRNNKNEETEEKKEEKTFQKSLVSNPNTIYSNNNY